MTRRREPRPANGKPRARGAKARPADGPHVALRSNANGHPDAGRPPSEGTQTEGAARFWLVKSEPDAFSWDQQVANGIEPWTGVRNHMAKANLVAMRKGDRAFFYHSNIGKEIVGVVEVVREAYPDPTADAGAPWVCVDMKAVGPVPKPVTLAAIKAEPELAGIALVRMSRLSVMPISPGHWKVLAQMGGWKGT
jgi:predicted RNA-binding protein with PUA-like domain